MSKVFIEDFRTGETLKRCSKCGQYKKLGEYHKSATAPMGVASRCKTCALPKKKYKNDTDRFWKLFHSRTQLKGSCLEWTGALQDGYPVCRFDGNTYIGKNTPVRRTVYRLSAGDLPDDVYVITTCRNRLCVRQFHLRRVTKEEMDVIIRNNAPHGDRQGLRRRPWLAAHGDRNGARTCPHRVARGERVGTSKITESDVQKIRNLRNSGMSGPKIAREMGISQSIVYAVLSGRNWSHIH